MDIHEARRWILKNVNFYEVTKNPPTFKRRYKKRKFEYLNPDKELEELQRQSRLRHSKFN